MNGHLVAILRAPEQDLTFEDPVLVIDGQLMVTDCSFRLRPLAEFAQANGYEILDVTLPPQLLQAPSGLVATYRKHGEDRVQRYTVDFLRHYPAATIQCLQPLMWSGTDLVAARDLPREYESLEGYVFWGLAVTP